MYALYLSITLPAVYKSLTKVPSNSEIPHRRRAPHLHGHDGLLPHVDPSACAPAAEHDEVRSCWYVVKYRFPSVDEIEGAVADGDFLL